MRGERLTSMAIAGALSQSNAKGSTSGQTVGDQNRARAHSSKPSVVPPAMPQ